MPGQVDKILWEEPMNRLWPINVWQAAYAGGTSNTPRHSILQKYEKKLQRSALAYANKELPNLSLCATGKRKKKHYMKFSSYFIKCSQTFLIYCRENLWTVDRWRIFTRFDNKSRGGQNRQAKIHLVWMAEGTFVI